MFEINGRVTTAICYAKVIEDEAIEQIRRMCDYDLTRGSKVRIMPDVHAGKGCTIGTTMTITDKICPNIVGVDIGCGMYTVKLQDQVIDFEKIDEAYYENPLLAVKWLFYLRDIRGNGMGERRAFRICFKWLVENHFDNVMALVELIPEYGRYDDWMCLLDSKAGEVVSVQIKKQLETDICNMEQGREISLLAKWLPSCNASSSQTKLYAKNICKMLGFKESEYRKTLSALRAYLNVVEVKMSAREWSAINYSKINFLECMFKNQYDSTQGK